MLAKDERNIWREQMKQGVVPHEMHNFIQLYLKMREDECWRSSRFYEVMCEAALVWYEENSAKRKS